MNQKEGVFKAINEVLSQNSKEHTNETPILSYITKEERSATVSIVMAGFVDGSIELANTPANKAKLNNEKELKCYVIGLVNNWMRKDTRLNGGDKYVAKNPGSRAGSSDPQLKTLKALRAQFELAEDNDKVEAVSKEITKRQGELAKEKLAKAAKEIDLSCLDEETRKLLGV